eukprot:TRINITY_DN12309_c0_g1_i1.p1 TRINITY_DN12309_c0_g1~~TRINITY_DN12309_c0_g1_i1.p1  ORF type:complete len:452 (-),score=125.15 TRINITY_DN12309_c0_g1_i1:165-1520(-)
MIVRVPSVAAVIAALLVTGVSAAFIQSDSKMMDVTDEDDAKVNGTGYSQSGVGDFEWDNHDRRGSGYYGVGGGHGDEYRDTHDFREAYSAIGGLEGRSLVQSQEKLAFARARTDAAKKEFEDAREDEIIAREEAYLARRHFVEAIDWKDSLLGTESREQMRNEQNKQKYHDSDDAETIGDYGSDSSPGFAGVGLVEEKAETKNKVEAKESGAFDKGKTNKDVDEAQTKSDEAAETKGDTVEEADAEQTEAKSDAAEEAGMKHDVVGENESGSDAPEEIEKSASDSNEASLLGETEKLEASDSSSEVVAAASMEESDVSADSSGAEESEESGKIESSADETAEKAESISEGGEQSEEASEEEERRTEATTDVALAEGSRTDESLESDEARLHEIESVLREIAAIEKSESTMTTTDSAALFDEDVSSTTTGAFGVPAGAAEMQADDTTTQWDR